MGMCTSTKRRRLSRLADFPAINHGNGAPRYRRALREGGDPEKPETPAQISARLAEVNPTIVRDEID